MVDHPRLVDIMTTEIQNMLKLEQTPEETLSNIRQKAPNLIWFIKCHKFVKTLE